MMNTQPQLFNGMATSTGVRAQPFNGMGSPAGVQPQMVPVMMMNPSSFQQANGYPMQFQQQPGVMQNQGMVMTGGANPYIIEEKTSWFDRFPLKYLKNWYVIGAIVCLILVLVLVVYLKMKGGGQDVGYESVANDKQRKIIRSLSNQVGPKLREKGVNSPTKRDVDYMLGGLSPYYDAETHFQFASLHSSGKLSEQSLSRRLGLKLG